MCWVAQACPKTLYIAEAGLEQPIFLLLPPECCDYCRYAAPHPAGGAERQRKPAVQRRLESWPAPPHGMTSQIRLWLTLPKVFLISVEFCWMTLPVRGLGCNYSWPFQTKLIARVLRLCSWILPSIDEGVANSSPDSNFPFRRKWEWVSNLSPSLSVQTFSVSKSRELITWRNFSSDKGNLFSQLFIYSLSFTEDFPRGQPCAGLSRDNVS